MNRSLVFIAASVLFIFFYLPAFAAEEDGNNASDSEVTSISTKAVPSKPEISPAEAAKKKKELKLHSDFTRFSDSWVIRLNAMHSEGRSKMVVVKEVDGFCARFHLIEKKSAVVRESPTRPGQYSGVLRYHDTVYECKGETEAASRNGEFSAVPKTAHAYTEIFQWLKGGWR